nr:hypothetical protein HK105_002446 [Polyrhizophydium stewartii]
MFVFEERIVDHILDIAVRRIRPTRGPDYVPVGANIIFLCARYAHYWNSSDMLRDFLNRAIEKIVSVLRASPDDVHFYAYWLSNTMQLLVYMKRDTGLLISTFDAQCLLSELIQEIYQQLVSSIERSILSIIDLAIIDYKKLDATSRVRYEPVFFGIGKRKSLLKLNQQYSPPRSPRSARSVRSAQLPMYELSPMSVNSILSSTLNVLKSCKVHQQVVHQLFHQLVYFINAELFNRIISTKELCCRARAQQIQLNLSPIQDWIRENTANLPQITGPAASYGRRGPLVQHLRPTMQLTQFLQVISATQDLGSFLELTRSMDALNTAHYHKSMENYRYEIGETSFSPEIEAYVQKLIDEFTVDKRTNGQLRHVQPRRLRHDADSEVPNGDVDSSGSSLAVSGAAGGSTSSSASDGSEDTTYRSSEDDMADDQLQDALNPLLDARAVLPFSVPNFGRNDTLWDYVPSIPAQVMEMMDDRSTVGAELTVSRAGVPSGRLTPLAAAATGFLAPILNTVGLAPTAAAPAASS